MKSKFFFQLPDKICIAQRLGKKGLVVSFKNSFCTVKRYLLLPPSSPEAALLENAIVGIDNDPLFPRDVYQTGTPRLNNEPRFPLEELAGVIRLELDNRRAGYLEVVSAVPLGRRLTNPFKRVKLAEKPFPGTVLSKKQLDAVMHEPTPARCCYWDYPDQDPRMK